MAMAEGARRVLGADVALSLTGVAGPAEQDGQPVGTLCIAVAMNGRSTVSTTLRMPGQRDQMRQMSVISSLDFLRKQLFDGT
jgi:nicotinamide-nucleotide amidase